MLVESGVGKALANMLQMIDLPLLPAAFIISLALRASQGLNRNNPDNRRVALRSGDGIESDSMRIGDAGSLLWWAWRVANKLRVLDCDQISGVVGSRRSKTRTVLTTILGFTSS